MILIGIQVPAHKVLERSVSEIQDGQFEIEREEGVRYYSICKSYVFLQP